ncbi:hypothetical protein RFN58_39160 [Streptomyces iakyrus]|nr:hypothetical protein [Streptomyces iakyrus]
MEAPNSRSWSRPSPGTALFLATDDSAHMTGAYLNADGGFNMIGA